MEPVRAGLDSGDLRAGGRHDRSRSVATAGRRRPRRDRRGRRAPAAAVLGSAGHAAQRRYDELPLPGARCSPARPPASRPAGWVEAGPGPVAVPVEAARPGDGDRPRPSRTARSRLTPPTGARRSRRRRRPEPSPPIGRTEPVVLPEDVQEEVASSPRATTWPTPSCRCPTSTTRPCRSCAAGCARWAWPSWSSCATTSRRTPPGCRCSPCSTTASPSCSPSTERVAASVSSAGAPRWRAAGR